MSYKGKYKLKKPEKYIGNADEVIYRSLWERAAFIWLENNDSVLHWSSEEIVVMYLSEVDQRIHRYFPDLFIHFKDDTKKLIEIKPRSQTEKPTKKNKSQNKYISESLTYVKNRSKWKAAEEYCEKNGLVFEIWDEYKLKSLGMKIYMNTNRYPKKSRKNGSKRKARVSSGQAKKSSIKKDCK